VRSRIKRRLRFQDLIADRGSPRPNRAAAICSDAIAFSHRFTCMKREEMTWASYLVAKIDGMPRTRSASATEIAIFAPRLMSSIARRAPVLLPAVQGGFHCRHRSYDFSTFSARAISMATK
jgi:hypothetical protein